MVSELESPPRENRGYRDEVLYLKTSEPVAGLQFVAQMALLFACCSTAWFFLGLWEAMVWISVFMFMTGVEKWLIYRMPEEVSASQFNLVRAVLFLNATIFDLLPIFLWFHPNELLKFGTLALVAGLLLNNINTRARFTSILLSVQIPNAAMLLAIGFGLIWIEGWSPSSITTAIVSVAIVVYFSVNLREAHLKEVEIAENREARKELAGSEKRLSVLAANFDGAIFRYRLCSDGSDRIDYMSQGAETVWGLKAAEIIGDPGRVWATVHPEDVAGVEAAFGRSAQDLTRINHRWRVILPSGESRWIECRCAPLRTDNGDTFWDGFVIDVSKAMAAREEIREKTEMLGQAQKMEAIGQIAGGIAHDFNNLLAVVQGNAELIQEAELHDFDRESLKVIIDSCSRGADLTRRLLSFARKSRLAPEVVNLKKIIDEMRPFLERVVPESIELKVETTDAVRDVANVDVSLFESSLLNLVLNARDAMPTGGSLQIRVHNELWPSLTDATAPNDKPSDLIEAVVIEVADTGHGIPENLLPRVTEPFVTSKGPDMGSGLGLAMVDGFVDQSGGKLSIESEVGRGTTIQIRLPLVDDEPTQLADKDVHFDEKTTLLVRALLVEDDELVRLTTSRQLRKLGVQVDAAAGGGEALEMLAQRGKDYDLLISDIVMPGQPDGLALAQMFRNRFHSKPVLLLSGYADVEMESDGADPLIERLTKPVGSKLFARSISNLLEKARKS